MRVWRVCRRPFAELSGEGARLYGGRWNSPGRSMVYAAESAALAVLEVRVHLDLDWRVLPDDCVLMAIETDDLVAETLAEAPADPRAAGDEWLASGRSALLRAPSFIVPESANVLVNPTHRDAARLAVASIRAFAFDARLWLSP
jgi:RES domain-containing protein